MVTNDRILLYPSPYPLPAGAREKFSKVTHENSYNSRHSERFAKESSNTNLTQLQGIKINLNETDHASMPLRVFASKSFSLLGWKAQPTIDSSSSLLSTKTTISVTNLSSYRLIVLSSFLTNHGGGIIYLYI